MSLLKIGNLFILSVEWYFCVKAFNVTYEERVPATNTRLS